MCVCVCVRVRACMHARACVCSLAIKCLCDNHANLKRISFSSRTYMDSKRWRAPQNLTGCRAGSAPLLTLALGCDSSGPHAAGTPAAYDTNAVLPGMLLRSEQRLNGHSPISNCTLSQRKHHHFKTSLQT